VSLVASNHCSPVRPPLRRAPKTTVLVRGDIAIAGDVSGKVHLFRFGAKLPMAVIDAHSRAVTSVALHAREFLFATGSEDSHVNLWAMPEAAAGGTRIEHRGALKLVDHPVTGLAFTTDGCLVAASYDIVHLRVFKPT
jgi:WD40 repeat protein